LKLFHLVLKSEMSLEDKNNFFKLNELII
jgi:hypothetical protein